MKDFRKKMADAWKALGNPAYMSSRLENNLKLEVIIGLIIMLTGGVMTCVNTIQKKGVVTWTTAIIFVSGALIMFFAGVLKKRTIAIIIALLMCLFIFSWYAVTGVNEGFAILWIMLVPLAFSYFGDVRFGVLLSLYYELLLIILFYTPIRGQMAAFYTKTFMDRFPVLYLCGTLLNSIAMIQYHLSNVAQMEYEKKLKKAIEEAENANAAKSTFLAQMSHEIRTPINAVLGMNEMILRESQDANILEYADSIDSAGSTLLTLINSILDFSKIEDGKMDIIPVKYDTSSFLNDLYQSIIQRAEAKGLIFEMDADEMLPCTLYGDDVRVSQVIMNLLTNAVKYTEKGSVRLSFVVTRREAQKVWIEVSVEDTGIGIREEDKKRMFESFERLDEVRNHNIEGTGLGISIVTSLLGMMGSSLQVESTYGKGSKFFFTICQEVADETPVGDYEKRLKESGKQKTAEDMIYAPDARILVVDDNGMNLKVVRNLLKLNGIKPDLVNSGAETIERMREKEYDIVFLDHMMPGMDGIETLHQLKEQKLIPEQTAIIALTANAVVGARENYLREGFSDYLSKPIEIGNLVEKLRAYLPKELYQQEDASKEEAATVEEPGAVKEQAQGQQSGILEFTPARDFEETYVPGGEQGYDTDKLAAEGVDVATGLRYCAGDKSLYLEMLSDYETECGEKTGELQSLYEDKNWKDYGVKVHALKSNAKMMGLMDLFEQAMAMEEAAHNETIDYIDQNHEALVAAAKSMAAVLKGCQL